MNKDNVPNGGFPPILICNNEDKKNDINKSDKREYSTHKSTISIKSILEKRRVVPFAKS